MNRKNILSLIATASMALTAEAQDIKLPQPNLQRSTKNVMETLASRHSTREYSEKELSAQDISDLCWAACGKSRDDSHITAPSAMNRQEIRLFVFTDKNVYEYNSKDNVLVQKAEGDNRDLLASNNARTQNGLGGFSQDFVKKAPVSLVMVIDFEKFGSKDENALMMGCVDAGNVSENINLYCESAGLCTVPRATMDVKEIRKLLGLNEQQLPIMNNPVGFPIK